MKIKIYILKHVYIKDEIEEVKPGGNKTDTKRAKNLVDWKLFKQTRTN